MDSGQCPVTKWLVDWFSRPAGPRPMQTAALLVSSPRLCRWQTFPRSQPLLCVGLSNSQADERVNNMASEGRSLGRRLFLPRCQESGTARSVERMAKSLQALSSESVQLNTSDQTLPNFCPLHFLPAQGEDWARLSRRDLHSPCRPATLTVQLTLCLFGFLSPGDTSP